MKPATLTRRLVALSWIGLAAGMAAAAGPLSGQGRMGSGITFEQYTFDDASVAGVERVSLVTLPFAGLFELAPRVALTVTGNAARAELTDQAGGVKTIQGLTDTRVGLSFTVGQDALVLSGAFLAPTGKSTQSVDEATVAGTIGSDLLPFRISNWGSGGGADASASWAAAVGTLGVGLRVGYRYVAEFSPIETGGGIPAFTYDPGDLLYARAAIDRSTSSGGKMSLAVTFQQFSEDVSEGTNLFAAGNRVQALGSYAFPWAGRGVAHWYVGVLHRAQGEFLQPSSSQPTSQDVFLGGLGARVRAGAATLRPGLDVRYLRTGDGLGQGYNLGARLAAVVRSGNIEWGPSAGVRYGQLEPSAGRTTNLLGVEIGLTLTRVVR